MAIGCLKTMENITKCEYEKEYDLIKFKIRRLSEYEAELLLDEYCKCKEMKSLFEII